MASCTQSVEEYLEAIFKLQRGGAPVTVGGSPTRSACRRPRSPRCSAACARAGLVEEPPRSGIPLTAAGAPKAPASSAATASASASSSTSSTCRGTRSTTRPASSSTSSAPRSRPGSRRSSATRAPARTATPSPARTATLAEQPLRPLSSLEPGDDGDIGCITEESLDLLRYLASLGLLPDTPVEVESVAPFGGPLLVRVGGLAVRPWTRGRRQDPGPRLTPVATTLRQTRARGPAPAPAARAARRLPRRQPQRRQVLAVQRAHRRRPARRPTAPA